VVSPREPRSLEAWEAWVEQQIVEAQERGEFDDLPDRGKPLRIEESPFAGGLEVGFGILKNAGIAPYWIELEKEIRRATAALEATLARAAEIANMPATQLLDHDAPEVIRFQRNICRWKRFWTAVFSPSPTPAERRIGRAPSGLARLRKDYLAQAAVLDKLITQYNAAIPRALWRLERSRLSSEAAAASFDAACRPPAE
jgi:hypothetical protein